MFSSEHGFLTLFFVTLTVHKDDKTHTMWHGSKISFFHKLPYTALKFEDSIFIQLSKYFYYFLTPPGEIWSSILSNYPWQVSGKTVTLSVCVCVRCHRLRGQIDQGATISNTNPDLWLWPVLLHTTLDHGFLGYPPSPLHTHMFASCKRLLPEPEARLSYAHLFIIKNTASAQMRSQLKRSKGQGGGTPHSCCGKYLRPHPKCENTCGSVLITENQKPHGKED